MTESNPDHPREGDRDEGDRNGGDRNEGDRNEGDRNEGEAVSAPPEKPSGLRNPTAAVRGVGAAALAGEALVLLLAIQPLRVLGAHLAGAAIGVVLGLAAACVILAGLLRHRWAWPIGYAPQAALIVAGLIFHPSLAILGVLFALVWLYVMHVRRRVTG